MALPVRTLVSRNLRRCALMRTSIKVGSLRHYKTGTEADDVPHREDGFTNFGFQTVRDEEKEKLVGNVFSSVAKKYDQMNDAMSLGIHRLWKKHFIKRLNPGNSALPMRILDVAGGTGDIAFGILDYATKENKDTRSKVIVADINADMLRVGLRRARDTPYLDAGRLEFVQQNAEVLDKIADNSIDLYTIAFGIRNCTHISKVLEQAYRVLKPGGVFSCLEFSKVRFAPLAELYRQYSFRFLPLMGTIIAGDRDSYEYLVESIQKFPDQETLARMIKDAGFTLSGKTGYENMTFGVAAIHTAVKL
ncbi:C-methytransferase [Schizosaccharomyces japonicus yFS275]|uniref:2-methoxy-6-polyprenyl-1,4-benzoquinol methylase, mitochondrial n=1 Tax=Schizosaccharomyces japonicus (strain yFS275 / FY16936) TaxID=402676 RepID=B6JXB6_SCHJY|nr:C-methytransferase [Schizosaccharomyces japonicus yFS275]EEB06017.1 C-methytransferase [Schizosaccharomyces japonicus yFS275]